MLSNKLTVYHQASKPGDIDYATGKFNNEVFNFNASVATAANMTSDTAVALTSWAKNSYVDTITTEAYAGMKIETVLSLNEIIAE